jgi:hypothetical protein
MFDMNTGNMVSVVDKTLIAAPSESDTSYPRDKVADEPGIRVHQTPFAAWYTKYVLIDSSLHVIPKLIGREPVGHLSATIHMMESRHDWLQLCKYRSFRPFVHPIRVSQSIQCDRSSCNLHHVSLDLFLGSLR